jgi:hypothetical protein
MDMHIFAKISQIMPNLNLIVHVDIKWCMAISPKAVSPEVISPKAISPNDHFA